MTAILYLNDSAKWPIQVLLRQIVIVSSGMQGICQKWGQAPAA